MKLQVQQTHHQAHGAKRGFTLLELMIATTIFGIVGYALSGAMLMAKNSHATVVRTVDDNEDLRAGLSVVGDELKTAGEATIEVGELWDGNTSIDFMLPIVVDEILTFGVYDESYGESEEDYSHEDWRVRYTVNFEEEADGENERTLVRQILNEEGLVLSEETLLGDLRSGQRTPPGFLVEKAGEMWEVTITMTGYDEETRGRGAVFHVRTRN